jgi:hypothetical protein
LAVFEVELQDGVVNVHFRHSPTTEAKVHFILSGRMLLTSWLTVTGLC